MLQLIPLQPDGGLVANAPHVPVHLGSMEHAVKFQHNLHSKNLRPGDVLVSNTPLAGGTRKAPSHPNEPIFSFEDEEFQYVLREGCCLEY